MDPSVALAFAGVVGAVETGLPMVSAISFLRGYKDHRRRIHVQSRLRFLRIFDIDLSKEAEMKEVATFPQYCHALQAANAESEINVSTPVASLAGSPSNGVRIYVEADFDLEDWKYVAHLRHDIFNDASAVEVADNSRSRWKDRSVEQGFRALCRQWMLQIPDIWYEVSSFVPNGRWSDRGDISALLMAITKEVCIVQHENDTLTMLVSFRSYSNASKALRSSGTAENAILSASQRFVQDVTALVTQYSPVLQKTADVSDRKKLLLLLFKHAQLLHMMDLTEEAKERYYSPRESRIDSRKSKLLPHLLKTITTDAYLYKEFAALADNYASVLESLVDAVVVAPQLCSLESARVLQPIVAELRGLCSEFRRSTAHMPKTLEHHLKFLEMRRNIEESSGLWMLTVPASIFLLLSLACRILSMQTRFKDLHYLLYDFCGVVIILLTLVAGILAIVKLVMRVHERWLLAQDSSFRPSASFTKITLGMAAFGLWAVAFASFIVGMFKEVRLGGLVLGYGFTGLAGLALLSCVAAGLRLWHNVS